jgi:hypothetical protein
MVYLAKEGMKQKSGFGGKGRLSNHHRSQSGIQLINT